MSHAVDQTAAWLQEICVRQIPDDRCWCCTLPGPPLVPIRLKRDLQLLDLHADACPETVSFCPSCAGLYYSSFAAKLEARQQDQHRSPKPNPGRKKTARKRA
jgi:hypothetical protein